MIPTILACIPLAIVVLAIIIIVVQDVMEYWQGYLALAAMVGFVWWFIWGLKYIMS